MKSNTIDINKLKQAVYYDPESGAIIRVDTGAPAGWIDTDGYTRLKVAGVSLAGTHVAHALMTGSWPTQTIDHQDRDPTNNRWGNLREATQQQQNWNQGFSKRNTSGVKGVQKAGKKWRARIYINYDDIHLGTFDTLEEAKLARMRAELEHYGMFSPLVST